MKTPKKLTITKEQQITFMKKVERDLQIELNMNFNKHRVHKNKKAYDRKINKKTCQNIW